MSRPIYRYPHRTDDNDAHRTSNKRQAFMMVIALFLTILGLLAYRAMRSGEEASGATIPVEDPLERDNLAEQEPELFEQMSLDLAARLRANQALHDRVQYSSPKKLDLQTMDTLRALGYVD